jgi:drug/metabolite transporter (DMT)-like permease
MTWTDWACLGVAVIGIVLFLYGANYYNAVVGWLGVFLFVGAIVAYLLLYAYKELTKKPATQPQNP